MCNCNNATHLLFNKQLFDLLIGIYQVSPLHTLLEYIATFKTKEQKIVDARAIENAI